MAQYILYYHALWGFGISDLKHQQYQSRFVVISSRSGQKLPGHCQRTSRCWSTRAWKASWKAKMRTQGTVFWQWSDVWEREPLLADLPNKPCQCGLACGGRWCSSVCKGFQLGKNDSPTSCPPSFRPEWCCDCYLQHGDLQWQLQEHRFCYQHGFCCFRLLHSSSFIPLLLLLLLLLLCFLLFGSSGSSNGSTGTAGATAPPPHHHSCAEPQTADPNDPESMDF